MMQQRTDALLKMRQKKETSPEILQGCEEAQTGQQRDTKVETKSKLQQYVVL